MSADRNTPVAGHPYRQPASPTRRPVGAVAAAAAVSPAMRIVAALLVVVCVWIGMIAWREHQLNRAVAALPVTTQQAAYQRAYDELSTMCAAEPALSEHCRAQAEFILRFPQCGADCDALARHFLTNARR